ncbi:MAG: DUF1566 domain-containing protein [Aquabacterium sp.]|nr:DUF1566 domain-containing protein [Aquabacterium sp.]
MMIRATALLTAYFFASASGAVEPAVSPNLLVSEDGAYVIDVKAKLAWPRCVEGMKWDGKTCKGQALLLTQAEAIALAADRKAADGMNWRLPRVTDLQKLTNQKTGQTGLDWKLFPGSPREWHWALTANVNTRTESVNQYNYGNIMKPQTNASVNHMGFLHGWAVNLETGEARGDVTKRTLLPVRLVRPQNL